MLKDGVVVYEHYDRTNTKTSVYAIFSILKPVTGVLFDILMEQGKLNTKNLVSSYVAEVKGSAYENLTVRQLLDMRSGINHDDASPEYRRATGLYPLKLDEQPIDLHTYIPTIQSSLSALVDGLDGSPFEYISDNADLMG